MNWTFRVGNCARKPFASRLARAPTSASGYRAEPTPRGCGWHRSPCAVRGLSQLARSPCWTEPSQTLGPTQLSSLSAPTRSPAQPSPAQPDAPTACQPPALHRGRARPAAAHIHQPPLVKLRTPYQVALALHAPADRRRAWLGRVRGRPGRQRELLPSRGRLKDEEPARVSAGRVTRKGGG